MICQITIIARQDLVVGKLARQTGVGGQAAYEIRLELVLCLFNFFL